MPKSGEFQNNYQSEQDGDADIDVGKYRVGNAIDRISGFG